MVKRQPRSIPTNVRMVTSTATNASQPIEVPGGNIVALFCSDILDWPVLVVDFFKRALHRFHMRVVAQRFGEGGACRGKVALLAPDHAKPGKGAEMAGFEFEHLVDVLERIAITPDQKVDRGPLVPCFGVIGMH